MDILFKFVIAILALVIALIDLVGLLFVMLISIVYLGGYIYDSILENLLLRIGHYIGRKIPRIKENILMRKIWEKMQSKESYLRYETPLVTYCFSYTAILLIATVLPDKKGIEVITASILYLIFYFVGMAKRCGSNENYYESVLANNMDFLKLSFLPVGFIITVLGFCFTITGMKIQEIPSPYDLSTICGIVENFVNYSDDMNIFMLLLKIFVLSILLLILLYIISLPIQVIAYFSISAINYFRKHYLAYKNLFEKYVQIVTQLLNL